MDYAMPRADDFCAVAIEDNPVPTPTNPLGVKGAGEAGTVGSLSAGVNAIVDALSVLGIKHIDNAVHAASGVAGDRERWGRTTASLRRRPWLHLPYVDGGATGRGAEEVASMRR
jgi:hypothetical protein